MHLREFHSGVIQSDSHSERAVLQELASLASSSSPVTAADVAAHFRGISLSVALQYLLMAEQGGALCRDDTMEGLAFYTNQFV